MVKRRFLLGDEWLYYKIYCGVRTADFILEELVSLITQKLLAEKLIHSWFFIRYGDPDPHLRLRFKIADKKYLGKIIDEFNTLVSPYVKENLIWNLQTDTYVRELERYGSNTMEVSEELFFYDSEFVLNMLSTIKDEPLYFFYALKNIDIFANQFGLDDIQKLEFYKEGALAYKTEFNVGTTTKLSLDKKYRGSRDKFNTIMNIEELVDDQFGMTQILTIRKDQTEPAVNALLAHQKANTLEIPLNDLLSSYIHMNVNRIFRDQQRFYEMLAYDFLMRYQNSKIKRPNYKS